MQDELNNLPPIDVEQPAGYPRSRYIALLIVLVSVLALIFFLRSLKSPESEATSEGILNADLMVKLYYGIENLPSPKVSGAKQPAASQEIMRTPALEEYRRLAAEKPTLPILRRLIIIDYPSNRPHNIKQLSTIKPSGRKSTLISAASEAEMWSAIYESHTRLSAAKVRDYEARIRRMNLGWYQHLALADLYERAGMSKQASEERSAAMASATRLIMLLSGLTLAFILVFLVGVGLLVWYAAGKAVRKTSPQAPDATFPPHMRSLFAGYLLEIFVIYMLIYIGIQFVMAAVLGPGIHARGGLSPHMEVVISFIQYTVWGLISLAYLSYRLRESGWSLKTIGLVSSQPSRDVLWGIGGYVAAVPLLVIAALISQYLMRHMQTPQNPIVPLFMQSSTWLDKLLLLIMAAIIAPIFEEIFFRGALFGSFHSRWGLTAGIIASAVVFAAVHPLPFGLLPIFVLGSTFATLRHQRGSLLPGMIAHGLNNAVAFIVLFILTSS